eukprot:CAMPEP_0196724970 /NCGR_PEP_ID=MMETSP1091-20130531/6657_1 /TAXON_ID=302021 /ORGANISM="Rhodomonas sp., Strain CCMP768" /LENGTH=39 /DNA_ID= /DNA_START= /DNA_END= /DNA_ORIENTATION=
MASCAPHTDPCSQALVSEPRHQHASTFNTPSSRRARRPP